MMHKKLALIAIFSAPILFSIGCKKEDKALPASDVAQKATPQAAEPDATTCITFGGMPGQVCPAAIFRLIANPEKYFGRVVLINGYVRKIDQTYYIFPSKDLALTTTYDNAVQCRDGGTLNCTELEKYADRNVTAIGAFSRIASYELSPYFPAGQITLSKIRGGVPQDIP